MTYSISPKARFLTISSVVVFGHITWPTTPAWADCVKAGLIVTCTLLDNDGYNEKVNDTNINVTPGAVVNNMGGGGIIAIGLEGKGNTVNNRGAIRGARVGIDSKGDNFTLNNHGSISPETDSANATVYIHDGSATTINNEAGGVIQHGFAGTRTAIAIDKVDKVIVNNKAGAKILAKGEALRISKSGAGATTATVNNSGTIEGTIRLDTNLVATINNNAGATIKAVGGVAIKIETATGQVTTINNKEGAVIDARGNIAVQGGTGLMVKSIENINNDGDIKGQLDLRAGNDTVTNTGDIQGTIDLGDGENILSNRVVGVGSKGVIGGNILGGIDKDVVTNGGFVFGNIELGDGNNSINNSGQVTGSVTLGTDNDVVMNSGRVEKSILLGGGNDIVTNSGFMGGNISLGDGNDTLTLSMGGTVGGVIDGGAGNDILTLNGGIAGQSQVFSNAVNNVELLEKWGAGKWVLANNYSFGLVDVNGGELDIATGWNVVATGGVTVTRGTFSGLGRVQGNVDVFGTLRPGDGVTGTLTVTGDVTVNAGSSVEVSVGPGTAQTKLAVSGNVNLGGNGTLKVTVVPGLYKVSANYDVITAGVAVNGKFASAPVLPAGTKFTKFKLNYAPQAVQVQVERISYATIGNSYNQRQAGDGLFRGMAGSATGSDMERVAELFEILTDEAMRRALDSLSGEAWAGIGEVRGGVTRNFRALGMDRIGGNLEGIGVWGNVLQGQEDVKSDGNGERIRGDVRGLVGGVEYGFGGGKVGVMVGYGQGDLKLRSRGEGEVKLMMGGVYGGWNLGGIEVSGGVSYASGKQKVERHINVDPLQREVRGSEGVREFGMDVGVGYGIDLGMIRVTPEVGLKMARVEEKGFEENGGGAVSLSGERERSWEGRGHVRVEVSAVFHAGVVSFEPYVKGGYERVLVGKGYQDREVSFQQPGTEFNVRSTDGSKNMYMGGGGLNVGFGPVTVGVGYQQSIGGKRDERTFKGSLGIRW